MNGMPMRDLVEGDSALPFFFLFVSPSLTNDEAATGDAVASTETFVFNGQPRALLCFALLFRVTPSSRCSLSLSLLAYVSAVTCTLLFIFYFYWPPCPVELLH